MPITLHAKQPPGMPDGGPLTPSLRAMSGEHSGGERISIPGAELSRLVDDMGIRVAFLPTRGGGVSPWRRRIVLDTSYRGEGQARTASNVGLVAHELTHLLQRELGDPWYWPSGGLRPSFRAGQRWVGDSSNYMEALAYLVGWTVESDLRAAAGSGLGVLPDRLATLADSDARNATRYVVSLFPGNSVYRQNHRLESGTADGRIPPGGWKRWLGELGFSPEALDHIETVAAQGELQTVSAGDLERILSES